jgi:hypothetical protein
LRTKCDVDVDSIRCRVEIFLQILQEEKMYDQSFGILNVHQCEKLTHPGKSRTPLFIVILPPIKSSKSREIFSFPFTPAEVTNAPPLVPRTSSVSDLTVSRPSFRVTDSITFRICQDSIVTSRVLTESGERVQLSQWPHRPPSAPDQAERESDDEAEKYLAHNEVWVTNLP